MQMETFPLNPPINLSEEGNWLLAVTSFEATDSVFNITDENNGFPITTTGHWIPAGSEEVVDKLKKLLELISENDVQLHAKEVEKRGLKTIKEFSLSVVITQKIRYMKIQKLQNIMISKIRFLECN